MVPEVAGLFAASLNRPELRFTDLLVPWIMIVGAWAFSLRGSWWQSWNTILGGDRLNLLRIARLQSITLTRDELARLALEREEDERAAALKRGSGERRFSPTCSAAP
jgi:hypothetical protein